MCVHVRCDTKVCVGVEKVTRCAAALGSFLCRLAGDGNRPPEACALAPPK